MSEQAASLTEVAVEERGIALAEHYLKTGQAQRALDAAERADPDDLRTWELRSAALYELQRWEQAADAAQRGLALDPHDTFLLFYLAASERLIGDLPAARLYAETGLRIDPHDPDLLCEFARILMRTGWGDHAPGYIQAAEQVTGPDSIEIMFCWVDLALHRDDVHGARQMLERILALEPENHRAHTVLGDLASIRWSPRRAARHYEDAARLAPERDSVVDRARELRIARHPLARPAWVYDRWGGHKRLAITFGIALVIVPPAAALLFIVGVPFAIYREAVPRLLRAWYRRRSP